MILIVIMLRFIEMEAFQIPRLYCRSRQDSKDSGLKNYLIVILRFTNIVDLPEAGWGSNSF